jgi:cell volume regulation protein A
MNLIFFSLLDLFESYFNDNFPELQKNFESNFLIEGWIDFQQSVEVLSGSDMAIASAPIVLLAAGITIFLGVAGEAFFKRTGIPDIAFLMILGVIIGPVLGIIQPEVVVEVVPYFAAIALIIMMFDGGLNMDIKHVTKTAHFSLLLALLSFVVSVVIVTLIAHFGLGWEWLDSILLGSIVGGSSSVIVFNLVRNFRVSEETRSMLSFESAITDILAIIIAFILFEAILTSQFNIELLGQTIGRAVAVGLILGLGVGIPWMYVTTKLANAQHGYMLTLGILFVLFFMANEFGESGALTALVFGLMLGNKSRLSRILKFKLPKIEADDSMHSQLTFLVRSFFFVFVGLLASFVQLEYIVFGIIAAIAIYVGRVIVTKVSLTKRFSLLDKKVTEVMIPRGLAAAVLATFPLSYGLPNAEAYPQIIFFIIMTSVIITTIGLGKAKSIPPPDNVEGGFVKKSPDDKDETKKDDKPKIVKLSDSEKKRL